MSDHALNPQALMVWRQIDGVEWKNTVTEIAKIFAHSLPAQLKAIRIAWIRRDFASLKRLSAELKASCRNIGADEADAILGEIETASGVRDSKRLKELILDLDSVLERSQAELRKFLNGLQDA